MSTYRVRFFSDFLDSSQLKKRFETDYEAYSMPNYGEDKDIWITDGEDYTHIIIINTISFALDTTIPKKNIVCLAFEPVEHIWFQPIFFYDTLSKISKFFIGRVPHDFDNNNGVFVEKYAYIPHFTIDTSIPIPPKHKFMSIIFSDKTDKLDKVFGYQYRVLLVNAILERDWQIDIYGRGCKTLSNEQQQDPRIKGTFAHNEPYDDYQYHICIENHRSNAYISEKLTQPLVRGCTPIYLGAKNVLTYFPDAILLTGNLQEDLDLLERIIKNPDQYKKVIDIEDVKNRSYLLRNLDTIFA